MQVFQRITDYQRWRQKQQHAVRFIPTMGNLHAGHLSLVSAAKKLGGTVVVSIFVNPLQFSPNEDFNTYPRTLKADIEQLTTLKVDALFAPSVDDMYPHGQQRHTQIFVPEISHYLCGASRPHFFQGVATAVNKLLQIIRPTTAFFGEKDYQQLLVIKHMVADLHMDIDITGCPILRAADGLALSSRNNYLTPEQRETAPQFYAELNRAANAIKKGNTNFDILTSTVKAHLTAHGFCPDYVSICRQRDLKPATSEDKIIMNDNVVDENHALIILAAARLGKTRLIDNVRFNRYHRSE